MKSKIEKIFNSNHTLQCRLDILDVYANLRPASRLIVKKDFEAENLAKLLIDLNGHVLVGKNSFTQSLSKNGYVDFIDSKNNQNNLDLYICIYFSMSKSKANNAFDSDYSANDMLFGKSLGYPDCCINYVEKIGKVPSLIDSFEIYVNRDTYEPLTWPVAAIMDAALLPHFPCTTNCEESLNHSKSRLRFINEFCTNKELDRIYKALSSNYFLLNDGLITLDKNTHENIRLSVSPSRHLTLSSNTYQIN